MDTTTVEDAAKILQKYDVLAMCGLQGCGLKETPKEQKYFKKVHNVLFVSPETALSGMHEKAIALGWSVRVWNDRFEGEAKTLGPLIVQNIQKGECLLGAGETLKRFRTILDALDGTPELSEKMSIVSARQQALAAENSPNNRLRLLQRVQQLEAKLPELLTHNVCNSTGARVDKKK
jgi:hypothetical protein